jgi:hypothetical protein
MIRHIPIILCAIASLAAPAHAQFAGVYIGNIIDPTLVAPLRDIGDFAILVRGDNSAYGIFYDPQNTGASEVTSITISSSGSFTFNLPGGAMDAVSGQIAGSSISGSFGATHTFDGTKSAATGPLQSVGGIYLGDLMGSGTVDGVFVTLADPSPIHAIVDATGTAVVIGFVNLLLGTTPQGTIDIGGAATLDPNTGQLTVNFSGGSLSGVFNPLNNTGMGTFSLFDANRSLNGTWTIARIEGLPIAITPLAMFTIPSLIGGTEPEMIVFADVGGDGNAYVKNIETDLGASVKFTGGLAPKDARSLDDQNGNGSQDIAGLLQDEGAMRPRVEIRDSVTGQRLRNINYNKNHVGVAIDIIGDQNGNLSQEGVVLAKQITNNNRGRLLIRDLRTKAKVNNISLPKIFDVLALVMGTDISGNGPVDAFVLATRISDGKGFVLVWDTGGDGKIVNIQLPKENLPVGHDYLIGPGGVHAVTALALRTSDNKGRLFVFDALTAAKLWGATLAGGRTPIAVKAFQGATGAWRIAVLSLRTSDDRPVVTIYNGNTGALLDNVLYGTGQAPLLLLPIADTSLDPKSDPELAVIMTNQKIQIRDSVIKNLIKTLSLP